MTTAISSDIYAEHAAIETGSGYRMTYNFGNTPSAGRFDLSLIHI